MIFIKTKEADYKRITESILLDFLRQNTDRSGRVTERVELMSLVPFSSKSEDGNKDTFRWVFSSYDVDRALERVDPTGWDLKNYMNNPVVLWSHDYTIPAIGYAEDVKADADLSGNVIFNGREFDEFGWSIGQRVKFGSIRSGSVGFLVKEVEFVDHHKNPDEKADVIFRQQELLEFSICNVPCNPYANRKQAAQKSTGKFYFIGGC